MSARPDPRRLHSLLLGIIAFGVVLLLLVEARFLLVSLAFATLIFSLTVEAINRFRGLRIAGLQVSDGLASLLAVLVITLGLLMLSALVLTQANRVVQTAMQYTEPAQALMAELFGWMGADVEQAVLNWLRDIRIGPYMAAMAGQAGGFASGAVLVGMFVGFMFAERVWFQGKLGHLLPDPEQAAQVERVIGIIVRRLNHYLVVKGLISLVTGLAVYAVMAGFGLDLAMAMALLTFILNFIPNIGSVVATILTAIVATVQSGDQVTGLAVLGLVATIQFSFGQILDPMLLGRALRLSSLGIIVALAFWAAVWGIAGMFLAVPIMVSVMTICAHVPGLRPFAVLLSREGLPEEPDEV